MDRLQPGDAAPNVELFAPDGTEVATGELWRDRAVVIAFLRHFG